MIKIINSRTEIFTRYYDLSSRNSLRNKLAVLLPFQRRGQSNPILSVCLMNWPPLLVVFVSQGRNFIFTIASAHTALNRRCLIVTQHFYWERRRWSKQDNRICLAREKNYMRCESSFQLCPRTDLWCLSGPAESLSHWYRPSARGSTYDWQNGRSFFSILAECGLALSEAWCKAFMRKLVLFINFGSFTCEWNYFSRERLCRITSVLHYADFHRETNSRARNH